MMPTSPHTVLWNRIALGSTALISSAMLVAAAAHVVVDPDSVTQLGKVRATSSVWNYLGSTGHNPFSEIELTLQHLIFGSASLSTMKCFSIGWSVAAIIMIGIATMKLSQNLTTACASMLIYVCLATSYILAAWPVSGYAATMLWGVILVLWMFQCEARNSIKRQLTWLAMLSVMAMANPLTAYFIGAAWLTTSIAGKSLPNFPLRKWIMRSLLLIVPVGLAALVVYLYPNPNLSNPRPALWAYLYPLYGHLPLNSEHTTTAVHWLIKATQRTFFSAFGPTIDIPRGQANVWFIIAATGLLSTAVAAFRGQVVARMLSLYILISLIGLAMLGIMGMYPFGIIRYALPLLPAAIIAVALGWLFLIQFVLRNGPKTLAVCRILFLCIAMWSAYTVILECSSSIESRRAWSKFQDGLRDLASQDEPIRVGFNSQYFLDACFPNIVRSTKEISPFTPAASLTNTSKIWVEPSRAERGLIPQSKGSARLIGSIPGLGARGWGLKGRYLWMPKNSSSFKGHIKLEGGAYWKKGIPYQDPPVLVLPPKCKAYFATSGPFEAQDSATTVLLAKVTGPCILSLDRHGPGPWETSMPEVITPQMSLRTIKTSLNLKHSQSQVRSLIRNKSKKTVEVTILDWRIQSKRRHHPNDVFYWFRPNAPPVN